LSFEIAANMRLSDICPLQQLTVVTSTDQNPREITISDNVFPRRVSFSFSDTNKMIMVQIETEPEVTLVEQSVTGEIPILDGPPSDDPPIGWIPPVLPPWVPIPPIPPPPIVPPDPGACADTPTGPFVMSWDRTFLSGDPLLAGQNKTKAWFNCVVRPSTVTNISFVAFDVTSTGTAYLHLKMYTIDASGAHLEQASSVYVAYAIGSTTYSMRAIFDTGTAAYAVAGFELELEIGCDFVTSGEVIYSPDWPDANHPHFEKRPDANWVDRPPPAISRPVFESADGHIQLYWSDGEFDTHHILGCLWALGFTMTSDPGTTANTYAMVNAYFFGNFTTKHITSDGYGDIAVPCGLTLLRLNGVPFAPGLHLETAPAEPYVESVGTIDVYFTSAMPTPYRCGLGNVSANNVCPAV
jgi:hypothetical protein